MPGAARLTRKEYGIPQLLEGRLGAYQLLGVLEDYQLRTHRLLWEREAQHLLWKESWVSKSFGKELRTDLLLRQTLASCWLAGTELRDPWVTARSVH